MKLQGTEAFLPGIGHLGTSLPPTNKSLPGLKMYIDSEFPAFVTVETTTAVAMVPLTNIQVAQFEKEVVTVVESSNSAE
jgi:hypothetical protein